jgi:hypothetical protein
MNCKSFQEELTDLVLIPNAMPSPAAAVHLKSCPPCTAEYLSFQQTFDALDGWSPVEPSPFFDQKLAVRLREEQAAPVEGWLERLRSRFLFNTGRNFRPALAGALALVLIAGGGGLAELNLGHTSAAGNGVQTSATVTDLQILDRNDQTFQQMDELQQDGDNSGQQTTSPVDGGPPAS